MGQGWTDPWVLMLLLEDLPTVGRQEGPGEALEPRSSVLWCPVQTSGAANGRCLLLDPSVISSLGLWLSWNPGQPYSFPVS